MTQEALKVEGPFHVVCQCDKCKAQPEPVAWLEPEGGKRICPEIGFEATITSDHPRDLCWIPLYPHPPQRTEPVIDKSAAIRIATALGWTPPLKENT